jgi:hypothetical protein
MKVKIEAWVLFTPSGSGGSFQLFPFEMENIGYVTVNKQELEVEVPDNFDPRIKQVELLRKERERINAEFYLRVTEIDEQINRLTALEHTT